jgi:PAS domain S-box-containing protein
VLVVGAAEPEIQSWLRAAGHLPRAVRRASAAGAALAAEPVDLVIVDRDSSGKDAPEVCRVLRDDPRLGDAWMLAITVAAKGRMADSVLNAGADDYLHRPFTRAELIARTRAGLRAAQERSNDRLLRTLMENVPGAIYRSAWHADHQLEMITDEIERISGYPPQNFIASTRRTILTLIHPEDLDAVVDAISRSEPDAPFELEYRIIRADGALRWVLDRGQLVAGPGGRLWLDGAMFDITERKGAEEAALRSEVEAARTAELRASRARIIEAADKARRKIERDLHDGAQQRMVSLVLDVQVAKRRFAKDPTDIGPFLE